MIEYYPLFNMYLKRLDKFQWHLGSEILEQNGFLRCCFWCFPIFQVSKKLLAYQQNASIIRFLHQAGSSGSKYHNNKIVGCLFEDELAAQIVLRKNNQENEFSKTICVANSSLDKCRTNII